MCLDLTVIKEEKRTNTMCCVSIVHLKSPKKLRQDDPLSLNFLLCSTLNGIDDEIHISFFFGEAFAQTNVNIFRASFFLFKQNPQKSICEKETFFEDGQGRRSFFLHCYWFRSYF
jgi:hypothetical protein